VNVWFEDENEYDDNVVDGNNNNVPIRAMRYLHERASLLTIWPTCPSVVGFPIWTIMEAESTLRVFLERLFFIGRSKEPNKIVNVLYVEMTGCNEV
jgi:hypothetical protein